MKTFEISTEEMEYIIANHFGIRTNLIVPNVSWGLGIHECDLLICTKSGYCTEIEIKISAADLKKDKEKQHGHNSDKIKYLYFAIPDYLNTEEIISHIPERAGILTIRNNGKRFVVLHEREPQRNVKATKLTTQEQYEMARLGSLRIWGLKNKCTGYKKERKQLLNKIKELETKIKGIEEQ